LQILEELCPNNLVSASLQKKRKKRGKLLYSSRRVLERSRMRASKHMSRLSAVEELEGVRIDFSGEDVTNLSSLQEEVAVEDASQGHKEKNVKLSEGSCSTPIVRHHYLYKFESSMLLYYIKLIVCFLIAHTIRVWFTYELIE
jgi:hypothetical protein